ncbi:hypothetical protein Hanom_Chr02g00131961 [Helianthus anomalus]
MMFLSYPGVVVCAASIRVSELVQFAERIWIGRHMWYRLAH